MPRVRVVTVPRHSDRFQRQNLLAARDRPWPHPARLHGSRGYSRVRTARSASRKRSSTSTTRPAEAPSHNGGTRAGPRVCLAEQPRNFQDPLGNQAEHGVRSELNRDRALGAIAEREARYAQRGGLLLDAAGVGEHGCGPRHQAEEVEVAERRQEAYSVRSGRVGPLQRRARPRMHRKHHRQLAPHLGEPSDCVVEKRTVDERRSVEGHEKVAPFFEIVACRRLAYLGAMAHCIERVDHRVSDCVDGVLRDPFAQQVRSGLRRVDQVNRCQGVREDAVQLLRHRAVEAAQPRQSGSPTPSSSRNTSDMSRS